MRTLASSMLAFKGLKCSFCIWKNGLKGLIEAFYLYHLFVFEYLLMMLSHHLLLCEKFPKGISNV